ncbi:hypothetical protein C0971_14790 [Bacillus methanolicus]|uniref:hypothetical protein n=1 Tax=Bacillus methanolicus TaxID=1471 RepID=UPI00200EA01B|nr:hypothetical protein [Bacillus methanolicus]UQD53146.1 hypothetical protein C0971_14790 [Bacillus methanolicus]
MKKLILVLSISALAIFAAACGKNKVDGKAPSDIPVEWATAMIQRDDASRVKLLQEKTKALDPKQGPQNNEKLRGYQLTEWKASNDKYYYEIKFIDPVSGDGRTERMEIVKTDSGWKRTDFSNLKNFETLVSGLEPKVLKEMHEE